MRLDEERVFHDVNVDTDYIEVSLNYIDREDGERFTGTISSYEYNDEKKMEDTARSINQLSADDCVKMGKWLIELAKEIKSRKVKYLLTGKVDP